MRRGPGPSAEDGFTLIELLVAVTIMGVAFVAILDGMIMSVRSADLRSKRVTVERVLGNFAEAMRVAPAGTPLEDAAGSPVVSVDPAAAGLAALEDGDVVWIRVAAGHEDGTDLDGVRVVDDVDRTAGSFVVLNAADLAPAPSAGYDGQAWFVELSGLTVPDGYLPRVAAIDPWDIADDEALPAGSDSEWVAFSLEVEGPPASLSDEEMLRSTRIIRRRPW